MYVVDAVLYNCSGLEVARKTLDATNVQCSLAKVIEDEWVLNEGDMIKIETISVDD